MVPEDKKSMENIQRLIGNKKPQQRFFHEMLDVLKEQNTEPNRTVYDVYRGVDINNGLRRDITVLYPEYLGKELPKTYGHYHKNKETEEIEVLSGKGYWLLQKYETDPAVIEEAILVELAEGQKFVYPPGFGHIMVNAQKDKPLIVSNWSDPETENDYSAYQQLHGACYYLVENGKGGVAFEKNKNYRQVPELKRM